MFPEHKNFPLILSLFLSFLSFSLSLLPHAIPSFLLHASHICDLFIILIRCLTCFRLTLLAWWAYVLRKYRCNKILVLEDNLTFSFNMLKNALLYIHYSFKSSQLSIFSGNRVRTEWTGKICFWSPNTTFNLFSMSSLQDTIPPFLFFVDSFQLWNDLKKNNPREKKKQNTWMILSPLLKLR
jgi:hypothetical protein